MKKLLALTAISMAFAAPAMAHDHMGKDKADYAEKYFEKADTNNDGMVSRSEYEEMVMEKFMKKDTDNDGNITMEEVKEYMEMKKDKMKEGMDDMDM